MKNLAKLLPETLFLVLLATIPIQLGKHFWPDFAQVLGIRIDLLAPTVYFTDIVIFFFVLTTVAKFFFTKKLPPKNLTLTTFAFFAALVLATLNSANKPLSLWFLFKLTEFAILALCVANLDFKKIYPKAGLFLAAGGVFATALATFQFLAQKSAGFWILGERSFNISTPGISKISLGGSLFLRPYATFPHPNVLAGFLAVALILFFLTMGRIFKKRSLLSIFFKILILTILFFGVVLTFSRSAWLALAVALIFAIFIKFKIKKPILKITASSVFVILVLFVFFPQNLVTERFLQIATTDRHSLILRTKLASSALKMFTANPVTGVGPGNFLPSLPKFWTTAEDIRFLQPVHNIFLLILAETGIVGILTFGFLLLATFWQLLKSDKVKTGFLIPVWIIILIISAFDHYFWTLQQGQILFWLVLGLSWLDIKDRKL